MKLKKLALLMLPIALLLTLTCHALAAQEEEDVAEWTVLVYLCGSDLESRYGYATGNLEEISACTAYINWYEYVARNFYDGEVDEADASMPGTVNVLIETGGCREWHTEALDMDVDTNALQRWRYVTNTEEERGRFELEQTLPLASMADPGTLTDFIRWGSEAYPAKKTALVLWGHGGGSKTGIFIDELFNGDTMPLDELGGALRDGGVSLECLLFDACMMANVETACAVKDSARWMVASEETVAGNGTAIGSWLKQLYGMPEMDGQTLGRIICDTAQIKYMDMVDKIYDMMLTWSLIDLTKIDRVEAAFDRFYAELGHVYANYPMLMMVVTSEITQSEEYGSGQENMYDLAGVFYYDAEVWPPSLRYEMLSALQDAVVYCVRGSGRAAARGLSFCYAVDFDGEELDGYAHNCPSMHCLAFLDAITTWTAPDYVYDKVERLPGHDTLEDYRVKVTKVRRPDGMPAVMQTGTEITSLYMMYYSLYRKDEASGATVLMGMVPATENDQVDGDGSGYTCSAFEPWLWPALEGKSCSFSVANSFGRNGTDFLGNIPIRMGTEIWNLRCGYQSADDMYTVYGLWEGYDSNTNVFNRNVRSLAQVAGQDFRTVFPVIDQEEWTVKDYVNGDDMTMYRALNVEKKPLDPGTYYIEYVINDMFMRPLRMDRVEMQWDGQQATFPGSDEWEGTVTLRIPY